MSTILLFNEENIDFLNSIEEMKLNMENYEALAVKETVFQLNSEATMRVVSPDSPRVKFDNFIDKSKEVLAKLIKKFIEFVKRYWDKIMPSKTDNEVTKIVHQLTQNLELKGEAAKEAEWEYPYHKFKETNNYKLPRLQMDGVIINNILSDEVLTRFKTLLAFNNPNVIKTAMSIYGDESFAKQMFVNVVETPHKAMKLLSEKIIKEENVNSTLEGFGKIMDKTKIQEVGMNVLGGKYNNVTDIGKFLHILDISVDALNDFRNEIKGEHKVILVEDSDAEKDVISRMLRDYLDNATFEKIDKYLERFNTCKSTMDYNADFARNFGDKVDGNNNDVAEGIYMPFNLATVGYVFKRALDEMMMQTAYFIDAVEKRLFKEEK